jgi:WD40 repeat protein
MQKFKILAISLVFMLGLSISIHAQTTLQPITDENASGISHLATLGADRIFDLAWSPDGLILAAIGEQGIRLYNPDNLQEAPRWLKPLHCELSYQPCNGSLEFSPDGAVLITGTDSEIIFWDTSNWTPIVTYQSQEMDMSNFAYDFTHQRLFYGGRYPNPFVLMQSPVTLSPSAEPIVLEFSSQQYQTLVFSQSMASDIQLSPDGCYMMLSYAVVNFEDRSFQDALHEIAIWDLESLIQAEDTITAHFLDVDYNEQLAEYRHMLSGHEAAVRQLAMNTEGTIVASAGLDNTVRLWSIPEGESLAVLNGHLAPVWDLAYRSDGRQIASVSWDASLRLWDVENQTESHSLRFTSALTSVAYQPNGNLVAVGGWDGSIAIVDSDSGEIVQERAGLWWSAWQIAFHPDGSYMATAMDNGEVILWNRLDTYPYFEIEKRVQAHQGAAYSLAFNHDGTILASSGRDGTIRFWDGETLESILSDSFFQRNSLGFAYDLSFSPQGNLLSIGTWNGLLYLWDIDADRMRGGEPLQTDEAVYSAAFHPTNPWLAYGDTHIAAIEEYRVENILSINTPRYWSDSYRSSRSKLEFSPDGNLLMNSSTLQSYIWQMDNLLAEPQRLEGFASFSPISPILVTTYTDQQINLYRLEDFSSLATISFGDVQPYGPEPTALPRDIAFSPDGRLIVVSSINGKILIWGIP